MLRARFNNLSNSNEKNNYLSVLNEYKSYNYHLKKVFIIFLKVLLNFLVYSIIPLIKSLIIKRKKFIKIIR